MMIELTWIEIRQRYANHNYGGDHAAFIAEVTGGVLYRYDKAIVFIPNMKVSDFAKK